MLLEEPLAEAELLGDHRTARARDDLGAELRHLPLLVVRELVVQRVRDGELEHGVAEKLEPLVRLAPVERPARMGEDGRRTLGWELPDQLCEARATGAT